MNEFENELYDFLSTIGVNIQIPGHILNAFGNFKQLIKDKNTKEHSEWLACWAYISIIDTRFAYGSLDSQIMSMEPMPSSVSSILKKSQCKIESFLEKMCQLEGSRCLSDSVLQHLAGVREKMVCLPLFSRLEGFCKDIFNTSTDEHKNKQKICWCIFLHNKDSDMSIDELDVLLICCLCITIHTSSYTHLHPPYDALLNKSAQLDQNLILKQLSLSYHLDLNTVTEAYTRSFKSDFQSLPYENGSINLEEIVDSYKKQHQLKGDINELDFIQQHFYLSNFKNDGEQMEADSKAYEDMIEDTERESISGGKGDGDCMRKDRTSGVFDGTAGGVIGCEEASEDFDAPFLRVIEAGIEELSRVYDVMSSSPPRQLLLYLKEYKIVWEDELEGRLDVMRDRFIISLTHQPTTNLSPPTHQYTSLSSTNSSTFSTLPHKSTFTHSTTIVDQSSSIQHLRLFQVAASIYMDSLASLIATEKGRVSREDVSALLRHPSFHQCLLACALEVVLFVCLPDRDRIDSSSFHSVACRNVNNKSFKTSENKNTNNNKKVQNALFNNQQNKSPKTRYKQSDSQNPINHSINHPTNHPTNVPSNHPTNHVNTSFPWIIHLLHLESFDFFRVINNFIKSKPAIPERLSNHLKFLESSIVACLAWKENSPLLQALPSFKQSHSTSSLSVRNTFRSVSSFLSRVRNQGVQLIRKISSALQLSNEIVKRMCACFDFCLQNKTFLFIDRHLDQLLMCCMYGAARVHESPSSEVKFKDIIHAYKAAKSVCFHALIRNVKLEGQNSGTVIAFYNQVFVQEMKDYLCKRFQDMGSGKSSQLNESSPINKTPTRVLSLHNITLSPLPHNNSPLPHNHSPSKTTLTPRTITHFRIDDSPIGSLRRVSKKNNNTDAPSQVNKKLKFETWEEKND